MTAKRINLSILAVLLSLAAGIALAQGLQPPPDNWGTGPAFYDYTGDENFSGYIGLFEQSPPGGGSFTCPGIPDAPIPIQRNDFRVDSWWQWTSTCPSGGVYVMKSTNAFEQIPTNNTIGQDFSIWNPFPFPGGNRQGQRINYLQCQYPIVVVGIDADGPCGPTQ